VLSLTFPIFVLATWSIAAATLAATALLSRRRAAAVAVAFAGAIGLLLFHGLGYLNVMGDDAFISFRYAKHLADGLGPNWNSTGRVEGYTNFLWVGLLAGVRKVGLDIVVWSRVLGGLSTAATFFFVYRTWRLWADDDGDLDAPVVVGSVFVLLAMTSGLAFYTFSGLETPLFAALVTGSAYLYLRERRVRGSPWSAVALAATAMTRPEGLIVAAVTGLFYASALAEPANRRLALRRILLWAGVFFALYGAYFIWRYEYYGYLLPNTFYAKVGNNLAAFDRGLSYLRRFGSQYQLLPMLVGSAFLLANTRLRHDVAYVAALCGSLLLAVVFEGGDFMAFGRFIVPVLPLIFLTGVAGFAKIIRRTITQPLPALLAVSLALSLTGFSLINESPALLGERLIQRDIRALSPWLRENTPAEFTLASVAVGRLGYYSERDIVDLAGVNDTTIAHTDVADFGTGFPGHERHNEDYVLTQAQPDIIFISLGAGAPRSVEDARLMETVRPLDALLKDPRLWEDYQIAWLFHDGRWYSFLVRNDAVSALTGPGLADQRNLLTSPARSGASAWESLASRLQPAVDGLFVSSTGAEYGTYQSTPSDVRPAPGQRFAAVAWVKGTDSTVGEDIALSLREDDDPAAETMTSARLTAVWQPIVAVRRIEGDDTRFLTVHVTAAGGEADDAFVIREVQLRAIRD
jgi:hypothetical protein